MFLSTNKNVEHAFSSCLAYPYDLPPDDCLNYRARRLCCRARTSRRPAQPRRVRLLVFRIFTHRHFPDIFQIFSRHFQILSRYFPYYLRCFSRYFCSRDAYAHISSQMPIHIISNIPLFFCFPAFGLLAISLLRPFSNHLLHIIFFICVCGKQSHRPPLLKLVFIFGPVLFGCGFVPLRPNTQPQVVGHCRVRARRRRLQHAHHRKRYCMRQLLSRELIAAQSPSPELHCFLSISNRTILSKSFQYYRADRIYIYAATNIQATCLASTKRVA